MRYLPKTPFGLSWSIVMNLDVSDVRLFSARVKQNDDGGDNDDDEKIRLVVRSAVVACALCRLMSAVRSLAVISELAFLCSDMIIILCSYSFFLFINAYTRVVMRRSGIAGNGEDKWQRLQLD